MGTTATKLTYLNDTKGLLKDSINSLGGDLTSESTFRSYANVLNNIYDSLPKVSGTGSILSLTPTLKGRLGSIPKGDTYQFTTTGKNLLKNSESSTEISGVTITKNADESITLNGTSSANITYRIVPRSSNYFISLDSSKNYTLSSKIAMPSKSLLRLEDSANSGTVRDVSTGNKSITFSGSYFTSGKVDCFLFLYSGYTFNNYTIYPMLEEGTSMTSFEPYTGGIASPNPDYPQEIKSVTGLQKVTITGGTGTTPQEYEINLGKNLIRFPYNEESGNYNGVQVTINNDGSITFNGTANSDGYLNIINSSNKIHLQAGTYTMSIKNAGIEFTVRDTSGSLGYISRTKTSVSFTINEDTDVYFFFPIRNGISYNLTVFPMLEKGSAESSYSPYFTPIKLNKIGDYQDYITGTPDNWSIKRQIGSVVLDGSETISGAVSGNYFATYQDITNLKSASSDSVAEDILSNNFIAISRNDWNSASVLEEGIGVSVSGKLLFKILSSRLSNPNINGFKSWLSSNNTQVDYVLATETTEAITNQEIINQLNEIYYLQSYNGTTNITITSEDLELIMTASAIKGEA